MACLLVGDFSFEEVNALSFSLKAKGLSTVYRFMNDPSSSASTSIQLTTADDLAKVASSVSLIIATSFDNTPPTFTSSEMALNELIRKKASDFMKGNIIILESADLNELMKVGHMKEVNVSVRRQLAGKAYLQLSDRDRGLHLSLMYNYDKKVVVIGNGGREHALAHSLSLSPKVQSVQILVGNGGTVSNKIHPKVSSRIVNVVDYPQLIDFCKSENISLVVIGPEEPLIEGIANALTEAGINCFGPSKEASILEASKAFSKDFFKRNDIPTATYETFSDYDEAVAYVNSLDGKRVVVKASGIAAGKGVLLPESAAETLDAIKAIMLDKTFGDAGNECVIEEFLEGEEVSVFAFCDGERSVCMPPAQDHKRAHDNDQGLNTGGMGAYAPAPVATPRVYKECQAIIQNTVKAMRDEGMPYRGVLYGGFMVSDSGKVKVLEYNCRFGDPETQVLLPLLSPDSDLYDIMLNCSRGLLNPKTVKFTNKAACTVVCAAPGYPSSYPKGLEVKGLQDVYDKYDSSKIMVYHAGTTRSIDDVIKTSGGRVLAVTGISDNLSTAIEYAYEGISQISFDGMHHRTDIAAKAKPQNRPLLIGVLGSTRGTALLPVLEAISNKTLQNVKVVCIVTNKKDAGIIDKANTYNIDCHVITAKKGVAREEYDCIVNETLKSYGVQLVLMIGWMRIVSPSFTGEWKNRCMNVHPSLLPDFAGGMDLRVHEAVLAAGRQMSGCTVHFVTDEVDGGPIVVQSECEISKNETPESLKAKVQALEGQSFIRAIEMFRQGFLNTREVLSYKAAGVDIDAGEALVERIKPYCKATRRKGCDASLGGFGGLFNLAEAGYDPKETILVSGTDGVGTKLKIAQSIGIHDTIGIDLVAMCVNDILVCGAEPLFFLDYYACGHLDVPIASDVVKGIAEGCSQAGCALIGGETAEMAGMYSDGEYDLAGFSVGAVNKNNMLPLPDIGVGDILLALPSSGVHSNGYSLVRKCVEKSGMSWTDASPFGNTIEQTLGQALLCPTYIYVQSLLPLIRSELLKGMAHITGGGLLDNIPRVLPKHVTAVLDFVGNPYTLPEVFQWLQQYANLPQEELLRTFNCGIGMVLVVPANNVDAVMAQLQGNSEDTIGNGVFKLGYLKSRESEESPQVVMNGSYSMS